MRERVVGINPDDPTGAAMNSTWQLPALGLLAHSQKTKGI